MRTLLLASLALPFIVRNADTGGGEGGAALPAFVDSFDSLLEEDSNPFEVRQPEAAAEEPQGGEAAEKPEEADMAKPDAAEAPEPPESIDVDGTAVPLADLQEAYRGREANAELLAHGQTYAGAMEAFNSGADGAVAVIQAMVNAARDVYGEDAMAGLLAPDPLPEGIDEETLTPNEKALLGQVQAMQRVNKALKDDFQRTLDELKPVVHDRALAQAGDAYAKTVNAQFPGAAVDGKTVVAMMKEHGVDDPVKAYKLATYGEKAAEAAKTKEEPAPVSTMPRPGSQKTFDPNDKTLTADRMIRLLEEGFVPLAAKA